MWPFGAISIRTRILLFQLVVGMAVLSMLAAGLVAIRSFDHQRTLSALANRQLDALASLAIQADQYSEAVAKLLVTAGGERLAVARLHSDLQTTFQKLQRATEREYEYRRARGEAASDEADLQRNRRLFQLYADMNAKISALLAMRQAGESEVAVRVFYSAIDSGLDDAFEQLVAQSVGEEIAEVEQADRDAAEVARAAGLLIGITALLAILGAILACLRLYRAIDRPIRRLTEGAVAIGRGDLAHRVGAIGRDEFGLLAVRFDEMAAELADQRERLVAAHSGLEDQVQARTAELETANRLLKEQDASRVRLLADISHELRTPLTIMRGEAEVTLRDQNADLPTHRRTLAELVAQAREMASLVEDLLIASRSETEDIRFDREPLDLAEVAAEAAREAGILGRAGGVRIRTELDSAPVEGDRRRMKQVLMILLDNAVKYSVRGGDVSLRAAADGASSAVTVRNRSRHPVDEDLPQLFDRFYRGRDAAAQGTGSGLGLAIARWMVEKQGGAITLAREDDWVGVSIRFPAAPAADAEPRAAAE